MGHDDRTGDGRALRLASHERGGPRWSAPFACADDKAMPEGVAVSVSRRAFLGTVAAAFADAGTGRAGFGDWLRDRHYRLLDRQTERYKGPVDGCGFLDQPAFSLEDRFRPPQAPYSPQTG